MKQYYVYVLASRRHGTLYVGVTGDLLRRVWEHKDGEVDGFTKRYGITRLDYFEVFQDPEAAIRREKVLKRWPREWKINLIEQNNPDWSDLYSGLAM